RLIAVLVPQALRSEGAGWRVAPGNATTISSRFAAVLSRGVPSDHRKAVWVRGCHTQPSRTRINRRHANRFATKRPLVVPASGPIDSTLGYPARGPASWRRRSEFPILAKVMVNKELRRGRGLRGGIKPPAGGPTCRTLWTTPRQAQSLVRIGV